MGEYLVCQTKENSLKTNGYKLNARVFASTKTLMISRSYTIPELPEVHTIKNQLSEFLPFKIQKTEQSDVVGSILHTPFKNLNKLTITEILRKGKMLRFKLDNTYELLSHLGMTGSWRISENKIKEPHTHLQFSGHFNGKKMFMAYVDPRRFGHMYYYTPEQAKDKLAELGHDLKSEDFTFDYFKSCLLKYPKRLIKVCLLDQKLFAGTGNYIANEICAHAKVLPQRTIASLTFPEIKKLYQATFKVIDDATQTGGTTFQGGYKDANGSAGFGVQHLVVFYQKTCQICKQTPIKKITLGQRGTYYCPECQK